MICFFCKNYDIYFIFVEIDIEVVNFYFKFGF